MGNSQKNEIAIYTKAPDRKKERGNKKKMARLKRLMREKRRDEEMGPDNEETTKKQTKKKPTKKQTTYEITLTLPTTEKETTLTQIPVKAKQDKNTYKYRNQREKSKLKRQRENMDQEPTTEKRHTEPEPERGSESEQQTVQDQATTKVRNTTETTKQNVPNKTVTVQTKEGQYEATLTVDNDRNFPLREKHGKLGLTRYRISKPPMMMHNIPRYYTTKNLMNRHVLKFDIRKPDPHQQLWNRQEEERGEHHIQECIIETTNEIEKRNDETTLNDGRKRNKAREAEQGKKQKRRKLGTTSEPDAHEARTENSTKTN